MLKYVSKFVLEIFPSLVATIVGAYIVNHYIVGKPADAPAVAAASSADPKPDAKATTDIAAKSDPRTSGKPSEPATAPDALATKSKSGSDKGASDKPVVVDRAADKSADKSLDTVSAPAEPRRHQPAQRDKSDKAIAKPAPSPTTAVAATPVPVETPAPEERRDVNDLARAAIERLRGSGEPAARPQDTARVQEAPRIQDVPRTVSVPVAPLPPAIMVSTPGGDPVNVTAGAPAKPLYPTDEDSRRPRPPANIPSLSQPLDLQADATGSARPPHTTVADDMLMAAKSVFHAVLPK